MKIINDKGIGIRKAVFTTIKIFVDNYGTKINVSETIQILINGLTDNEDIGGMSVLSSGTVPYT